MNNPYEYYNGKLGVQGSFLVRGRDAHKDSLELISIQGLNLRIQRGATIRLRLPAENSPMLVQFDTIPLKWQEAVIRVWGDPPKMMQQTLFERYFERDASAFDFFTMYRFDDGTAIDRPLIDIYTMNASVYNTARRIYKDRYRIRKKMGIPVNDIWKVINAEIQRFRKESGHTLGENEAYLRRKYNEYIKGGGYVTLISGKHKNVNARKVFDDTEQLLNNMFADQQHKPTKQEIYSQYDAFLDGYVEVINTTTGEAYNPKDFKKLSDTTVYNYLTKWENEIATLAKRSGDRQKYMGRFKPYHSLEQPEFAGSIISIDDRQPVFEYAPQTRMWFYNGIDLGSEAFTCWVYGKSKEGIILEFYRQMVRNYHDWGIPLPAELEGELSLNSSFMSTFLQEGNMFQYVRIEANNARGKRIEQYYRPLRYQYEKKREGWLARPFALSEANQAGSQKKKLIPYDDIVAGCLQDIVTWNNTEHSKIKGMSRWDVFLAMQNPNTRPTNYHGILPYLGYKTKTSVHAGIINFREKEFLLGNNGEVSTGDSLILLMRQVEGKDIDIYWLDDNRGNVLKAYIYLGTQFICEAVAKPTYKKARIEQTAQDMMAREIMSKYVMTVEGFGNRQRRALDNVMIIDNRQVTIGNSFSIDGVTKQEVSNEPAKVLDDMPDDNYELEYNYDNYDRSYNQNFRNSF